MKPKLASDGTPDCLDEALTPLSCCLHLVIGATGRCTFDPRQTLPSSAETTRGRDQTGASQPDIEPEGWLEFIWWATPGGGDTRRSSADKQSNFPLSVFSSYWLNLQFERFFCAPPPRHASKKASGETLVAGAGRRWRLNECVSGATKEAHAVRAEQPGPACSGVVDELSFSAGELELRALHTTPVPPPPPLPALPPPNP